MIQVKRAVTINLINLTLILRTPTTFRQADIAYPAVPTPANLFSAHRITFKNVWLSEAVNIALRESSTDWELSVSPKIKL